ncbi:hypothetical protein LINGRAHAP2_LOCUS474 [Linum grandiflorum]
MDNHIRFSAQVLSCLLGIPIIGQVINEEADMWRLGFDGLGALLEICPAFPLGFLPSRFLARSFSLDELLPLDIFILWHAANLKPISLPHLLLIHITNAATARYPGDLPCAPIITQLLLNMGLDLYGFEMVDPPSSLPQQMFWRSSTILLQIHLLFPQGEKILLLLQILMMKTSLLSTLMPTSLLLLQILMMKTSMLSTLMPTSLPLMLTSIRLIPTSLSLLMASIMLLMSTPMLLQITLQTTT